MEQDTLSIFQKIAPDVMGTIRAMKRKKKKKRKGLGM